MNKGIKISRKSIFNQLGATLLVTVSLLLAGCQTANTTATTAQLQQSYQVEKGTITSVEQLIIDDSNGDDEGAIIGAIAGAIEGGDEDGFEGAIIGAVAGGIIGGVFENIAETNKAYELNVLKDDGSQIRVLQRIHSLKGITINDRVEILTDPDGKTIIKRT